MLVTIENLKKGDEIMLAQGCKFIIARIMREPALRWVKDKTTGIKVPKLRTWGANNGTQLYSSMKCEVKTVTTQFPANYPGGKPYSTVVIDNTLPEYNEEKYFNLNFRDIWLIEK